MKKYIILIIGMIILMSVTTFAGGTKIIQLDENKDLNIEFKGSRIRVDSWNNDYIKIETTYLVKKPFKIEQDGNTIKFSKEAHLNMYPGDLDNNKWAIISNEVYFIITVPQNMPLIINAESVNVKENCTLKYINAKNTRIRGSKFVDGFVGKGEKLLIRDNRFLGKKDLKYKNIYEENYRGFWWTLRKIVIKNNL